MFYCCIQEVEFSGHRFPLNLNNVHAVNYVLTQQQGKLKIKDLKHGQFIFNLLHSFFCFFILLQSWYVTLGFLECF